jgi:hypothetical protein
MSFDPGAEGPRDRGVEDAAAAIPRPVGRGLERIGGGLIAVVGML